MKSKKNVKIVVIVILIVVAIVIGCFLYDRLIFRSNKIFKNIKGENNLKITGMNYFPNKRVIFESSNQEMINEIINIFDKVKVKKNTEVLNTGYKPYIISGENFSIQFDVNSNILGVNGKSYITKIDSSNENLSSVIVSIFEKYGIDYKSNDI